MTLEDVHATLIQQNMITVRDAAPVVRPIPGQTIKYPKGRKNGVARRHLQRAQTIDKGTEKQGPFVPPADYEIKWDKEKVKQYLQNWESKGYLQLRPDKLKWSPFVMSRTQKTEALQATATTTLETTNNQVNGKSATYATPPKALSNGDRPSIALHEHALASDDELAVDLPLTDKKATRMTSHQVLAENITPGRRLRNHLPTIDKPLPPSLPPVKRPRGRPRKVVQSVQVELDDREPPVLKRLSPRKQIVSSPEPDGSHEPDEPVNGISEIRAAEADVDGIRPPAFPSDDVKSERSSTPMTNGASVPSDDTIFAVNSLLVLKGQVPQQELMQMNREGPLDDADADADGDYDIEMEDA